MLLGSLAAVACGGGGAGESDGGGGSGGGTGGGAGGSCKSYVACDLLPVAQVNAALGTNIAMGKEADTASGGGPPGTYACEYGISDPTNAFLGISCSSSGVQNGAVVYQTAKDVAGGVNTDVSGLGSAAFWHTSFPDAGPTDGGTLYVFFGAESVFDIAITVPDASTLDPRAAAIQLAMAVLAKL